MDKFRWSMTEEDYERMQRMRIEKKVPSDNCFKGVAIGNLLFEWIGDDNLEETDYGYINCYEAGIDLGYGYLKDGTPYNEEDDGGLSWVSTELSYEEFKKNIEIQINRMAEVDEDFKKKIEKDVEPNWYGF